MTPFVAQVSVDQVILIYYVILLIPMALYSIAF